LINHFFRSGANEKISAAKRSMIAAVGLTCLKVVIGLTTGSLGILAEAAHSGLDMVAAAMTWLAIRLSDKPADKNHLYGHGKVENLSALFETLLLLGTCAWIIYEAIHRLVIREVELRVNIWAFGVMAISILVDLSRSRVLYRAARKYHSQALEADALHFSTDIWSSGVVMVGLLLVKLSEVFPGYKFFRLADSVSALLVGTIVMWISLKLGHRTIQTLLDGAPSGVEKRIIQAVEAIPGVSDCHHVRLRSSGPHLFIDIHVLVDGNQSLRDAHDLTVEIERTIQQFLPNADVTVHPEPTLQEKISDLG
jgi:cation diffusion facilitator family transporter